VLLLNLLELAIKDSFIVYTPHKFFVSSTAKAVLRHQTNSTWFFDVWPATQRFGWVARGHSKMNKWWEYLSFALNFDFLCVCGAFLL
jgi:hypothetical protein